MLVVRVDDLVKDGAKRRRLRRSSILDKIINANRVPSKRSRPLSRPSKLFPRQPSRGVTFRRLRSAYDAPASDMHFLVKLVSAAPASFCRASWSLQHFLAKLCKAAPCRLLPVAWTAQLSSAMAAVTTQNEATMMASVFMLLLP